MKRMNKVISVLSLFFILLFASCSFSVNKKTVPNKAKVSFKLSGDFELLEAVPELDDLDSPARNAGSYTADSISNENLYYKLYYTRNVGGADLTWLETFNSLSELSNCSLELEYDTYTFYLEVYESDEENGTIYSGESEPVEITESSAVITISMHFGTAAGAISYTIKYPANQKITLEVTTRMRFDSGYAMMEDTTKKYSEVSGEGIESVITEDGISTAVYEVENLPPGYYAVVFKVTYAVSDTDTTDTFAMQLSVPVIPTVTTTGIYEFTEINKINTITYDWVSLEDSDIDLDSLIQEYPTSFKKYRRVKLPQLKKENNTFLNWYYYDADENKVCIFKNASDYYILNVDWNIDYDVTLYAEWEEWKDLSVNIAKLIPDYSITLDSDLVYLSNHPITAKINESMPDSATVKWYVNGRLIEGLNDFEVLLQVNYIDSIKKGQNRVTAVVGVNGEFSSKSSFFYVYDIEAISNEYDGFKTGYLNSNGTSFSGNMNESMTAFCYDSNRNLYASIINADSECSIKKYVYNKMTNSYGEGTVIVNLESEYVPFKMATDGEYVYYVLSNTEHSYSAGGIKLSSNNLYYVKIDEVVETPSYVPVPQFDYASALTFENDVLYIAGEKVSVRTDKPKSISYDSSSDEEVEIDLYNAVYSVYAYDVSTEDSEIVLTTKSDTPVLSYNDDFFINENPELAELPEAANPTSYYPLNYYKLCFDNIISDITVVEGKLYAIQNMFIMNNSMKVSGSGSYNEITRVYEIGYSNLLQKDLSETEFAVISLPKSYVDDITRAFVPVRFVAIKPDELVLTDCKNSGKYCSVNLPDGTVKFGNQNNTYRFDNFLGSSGTSHVAYPMNYHDYDTIKAELDD